MDEITASPPPFKYYHGEDLEDDPQLMLENIKKFQANVRKFTRFSVVSTGFEYLSLLLSAYRFGAYCELLQQMANCSYLKSQKLKEMAAGHQKITLLEKENVVLKKEKAALEQKVELLKEVIHKNRGNLLFVLYLSLVWLPRC